MVIYRFADQRLVLTVPSSKRPAFSLAFRPAEMFAVVLVGTGWLLHFVSHRSFDQRNGVFFRIRPGHYEYVRGVEKTFASRALS
jgi:hypothetical protein